MFYTRIKGQLDVSIYLFILSCLIAAVCISSFIGMEDTNAVSSGLIPSTATNVVEVDDNWTEFTYKGERVLFFHTTGQNKQGYSAAVIINN